MGCNLLRLTVDHGLLSDSFIAEVILKGMLHEHSASDRVDRLLVHLLDVLDVGAHRDLVSGLDLTDIGKDAEITHFLYCLGHLAMNSSW